VVEPPARVQGSPLTTPDGGHGAKPSEAESSVAFEAPVEESNVTLE